MLCLMYDDESASFVRVSVLSDRHVVEDVGGFVAFVEFCFLYAKTLSAVEVRGRVLCVSPASLVSHSDFYLLPLFPRTFL